VALVLWFITLSLALRYRVMERVLGLQPSATAATRSAATRTRDNIGRPATHRTDRSRVRQGTSP
jgi:hypothetical protein